MTPFKRGLVVAILVTCAMPSFAFRTYGDLDCAQWFKDAQARSWLVGYLSGMNFLLADDNVKYDPLAELNSADSAFLWMDNYCKANPLKMVSDGGADLIQELQKKIKAKRVARQSN